MLSNTMNKVNGLGWAGRARQRRRMAYDVLVGVLFMTGAIGGMLGFIAL